MQKYILMVQADEDDRYLTESVLNEWQDSIPMHFVGGYNEVKPFSDEHGLPSIILINNQDHRHAAIELIRQLKAEPIFNFIPVIVLGEITTTDYIRKYYQAGANSYIVKPSTIEGMRKKIRLFMDYWFEVAELQQS